ncbi:MAG: cysteine synthase CysM [Spirochaetales bacterium]|nr:cysteine synthase CysM [Spirochaetales bacterium]
MQPRPGSPVLYPGILERIGGTPLVRLDFLSDDRVQILAKLEGDNPAGSVKDRPALSMIEEAQKRGSIGPGIKLIEPTSGNTGIALALIAALKGYELELVLPENSSRERALTMKAYGARVVLTPAERSMEGAIDYVREKVAGGGYVFLNQFANPDNPLSHYRTTGPEIYRDTAGQVTHFVSAMGTTGTIMGVSRYLKERNPDVQIIGAQPSDGSCIPGIRRWSAEYLPEIYESKRVDRLIDVSEEDARKMTYRLAREAGILSGMSSGGAVHIAAQVARELSAGLIVVIICDRGDRYLSTNLFS